MYLQRTRQLNPALILRATELHQAGAVPPACYVVDADSVKLNSEDLAAQARARGIRLFFMSKQIGHNREAVTAIRAGGIGATVAVDGRSAELLAAHGVPLAHVGHLSQIPARQLPSLLGRHRPEFVTVFNLAQATRLSEVGAGLEQPVQVLAKVRPDGPAAFPGQEGGFYTGELSRHLPELSALPGIRLCGVTAFPCTAFDRSAGCFRPTRELAALQKAAEMVGDHIGRPPHVNAPGNTSADVLDLLAAGGCTSAEPGHALTGTGPQHAAGQGPERPALVYVSEVTQVDGSTAIAFGGGLYRRGNLRHALVGSDAAIAGSPPLEVQLPGPEYIDYHFTIKVPPGRRVSVGDTVIAALRPQLFVGYSRMAAVSGLHTSSPSLGPIRDSQGLADHSWPPGLP
jgi:predicted amino acid racemase